MSRSDRTLWDLMFAVVLLVLVSTAVLQATEWALKPRFFPLAIGLPVIGLLVLQVVQTTVALRRPSVSESGGPRQATTVDPSTQPDSIDEIRLTLQISGWMLASLLAVWILGFPIGGPVAAAAFLRLGAREAWKFVIGVGSGMALLMYILVYVLRIPFPNGLLFDMVGVNLLA